MDACLTRQILLHIANLVVAVAKLVSVAGLRIHVLRVRLLVIVRVRVVAARHGHALASAVDRIHHAVYPTLLVQDRQECAVVRPILVRRVHLLATMQVHAVAARHGHVPVSAVDRIQHAVYLMGHVHLAHHVQPSESLKVAQAAGITPKRIAVSNTTWRHAMVSVCHPLQAGRIAMRRDRHGSTPALMRRVTL